MAAVTKLSQQTSRPTAVHWFAPTFVWCIWGVMLLAALWLDWNYLHNVPVNDHWYMVPQLTGAEPATASWLWSQYSEHRVPLLRLLLLVLGQIPDWEFRAGAVFSALALGALAFALI